MSRGAEDGNLPRSRIYGVDLSNSAFYPIPLTDSGTAVPINIGSALMDESSIKIIDFVHSEIHEGELYHFSNLFVFSATFSYIMVSTLSSTLEAHFSSEISTTFPVIIKTFSLASTSANGTEIIPYNRKIPLTNTTNTRVFINPTIVNTGSYMSVNLVGAGAKTNAIGGSSRTNLEWVLKANNKILIQFDTLTQSNTSSFSIDMYEH